MLYFGSALAAAAPPNHEAWKASCCRDGGGGKVEGAGRLFERQRPCCFCPASLLWSCHSQHGPPGPLTLYPALISTLRQTLLGPFARAFVWRARLPACLRAAVRRRAAVASSFPTSRTRTHARNTRTHLSPPPRTYLVQFQQEQQALRTFLPPLPPPATPSLSERSLWLAAAMTTGRHRKCPPRSGPNHTAPALPAEFDAPFWHPPPVKMAAAAALMPGEGPRLARPAVPRALARLAPHSRTVLFQQTTHNKSDTPNGSAPLSPHTTHHHHNAPASSVHCQLYGTPPPPPPSHTPLPLHLLSLR